MQNADRNLALHHAVCGMLSIDEPQRLVERLEFYPTQSGHECKPDPFRFCRCELSVWVAHSQPACPLARSALRIGMLLVVFQHVSESLKD
jgi:hypothetical protein